MRENYADAQFNSITNTAYQNETHEIRKARILRWCTTITMRDIDIGKRKIKINARGNRFYINNYMFKNFENFPFSSIKTKNNSKSNMMNYRYTATHRSRIQNKSIKEDNIAQEKVACLSMEGIIKY